MTAIAILEPVLGGAGPSVLGTVVPASVKRKFTKCIAYNGTASAVAIKIFLVPKNQAADTLHTYVDYDLAPRETYNCPEIIGAALNTGGQVFVQGTGVSFSAVASDA